MSNDSRFASKALQAVPFFANLNHDDAAQLSAHMIPRRFGPGQVIFHLGDPGGLLYIIREGKVKISHSTPDGQEALLAILGQGDFFGELALLDDSPRSATAESLESTETLTLHRTEFMRFIESHPSIARHVLTVLARRIRHLNAQISDIFFLDLPARLARTLLQLADDHGLPSPDGTTIQLTLTQTDLAEMTGATRVSVNKALGRFRKADWVKVKGHRFTVIDRDSLENLIALSGG